MIATTLVVLLALELLSLFTMPSVLLRRRGNPVSASMWLVALVALPGIAWLSWWIFGRTHLNRKARRRHAASERFSNQYQSLSQRNHTTIFDSFVPRRALNTAAFSSI